MRLRCFSLMALLVLLAAPMAIAQEWMGPSKLTGVVLDENEEPLAGATVSAVLTRAPDVVPPSVKTSRRGRFVIPRLVAGEWGVRIEAEGYVVSEGIAIVLLNSSKPLRVVLRPLSEVSPSFAETPASIKGWLQMGDSLLEQGHPAQARAEFEKALTIVPPAAQPPILRVIARTHVEEKAYDDAVGKLKLALVFGPTDEETRHFFLVLMKALQRTDEGTQWLERLDRDGVDAMRAEVDLPPPPRTPGGIPLRLDDDIEAEAPQPGRRGRYRVAFAEKHPLGSLSTIEARYDYNHADVLAADPRAGTYSLDNESFEVFVPEGKDGSTDPNTSPPMGLMVWISPTAKGQPYPQHLDVLRRHGIIWVGANNAGNPRSGWDRIGLAMDAAHNMQKLYNIDEERIYVGGYSGGGRIASGASIHFPEVFHGGFFVYGCDFYRDIEAPDKPGMIWPSPFAPPARETMKLVRERNRYVFLTGERDFNRLQTRTYERLYREEGFRHTTYFEIPEAHHYTRVPADWFDKVLTYLEK